MTPAFPKININILVNQIIDPMHHAIVLQAELDLGYI
jgi:hypothetical protein